MFKPVSFFALAALFVGIASPAHGQSDAPDTLVETPADDEPRDDPEPETVAPDNFENEPGAPPADETPAVEDPAKDEPPARDGPDRTGDVDDAPPEVDKPEDQRPRSRIKDDDPLPEDDKVDAGDFGALYGTGAATLGCMTGWTLFFQIMQAVLPAVGGVPALAVGAWPVFGSCVFCGLCCVLPGVEGVLINVVGNNFTPLEGSMWMTVLASYLGTWGLGFVALGLSAFANVVAISALSGDPNVWDAAGQNFPFENLSRALVRPGIWGVGIFLSLAVTAAVMAVAPAVPASSYLLLSEYKADLAAQKQQERERQRRRRKRRAMRTTESPLRPMNF